MTAEKKPPLAVRLFALVVAIGLVGWGIYDRIIAAGPKWVVEAVISRDPTIESAAVKVSDMGPFRDADGDLKVRHRLWCGEVAGRPEGRVAAVVVRYSYSAHVDELALGWDGPLISRDQWLLAQCEGAAG